MYLAYFCNFWYDICFVLDSFVRFIKIKMVRYRRALYVWKPKNGASMCGIACFKK